MGSIANKLKLASIFMALLSIAMPASAVEKQVTTQPQAFEGPSLDGEVPVLSAKSGGPGKRSQSDTDKNARIINQLCTDRGADRTLDRVGAILWKGADATNQGGCY